MKEAGESTKQHPTPQRTIPNTRFEAHFFCTFHSTHDEENLWFFFQTSKFTIDIGIIIIESEIYLYTTYKFVNKTTLSSLRHSFSSRYSTSNERLHAANQTFPWPVPIQGKRLITMRCIAIVSLLRPVVRKGETMMRHHLCARLEK